jgi:asparagine synthase (glutamine-hydrolysing)
MEPNLLPTDVLWRQKEAFSDGVSSVKKSWYEIIQAKLDEKYSEEDFNKLKIKYKYNTPQTKEQLYYREIFAKHYPGNENVIPYFWMPKYSNALDSSARSLDIYKKKMNLDNNIEE